MDGDSWGLSSNCAENHVKAVLLTGYDLQLFGETDKYKRIYQKSKSANSSIVSTSRSGRNAPSFNSSGKLN
jgi:hypothetical protein